MDNIHENIRKALQEAEGYFGLIIVEDGYVQPTSSANDLSILATNRDLLNPYVKDNVLGISFAKGELVTLFIKNLVNSETQKVYLLTDAGSAEIDFSEYAQAPDTAIRYLEALLNTK